MTEKSIQEMVHEYACAQLKSGKPVVSEDIRSFCLLALDVKSESKRAQKALADDERRRRW